MDAAEIACPTQVFAQAPIQLMHYFVRIAFELLGSILRKLGDSGLRRIPIARAILVKIRGGASQPPQRVTKNCRRLARHYASEFYASILNASMSGRGRRCRTKIDCACYASA